MDARRKATTIRRLSNDGVPVLIGTLFFALTIGIEKLDPRNISWLSFEDQHMHWLGWRFFAQDEWRWPLGANPNLGWERMNSIVFTDSFPGLAVLFKAVNLDVIDRGQFFGIGHLIGALLLFVGGRRLFSSLGLGLLQANLATAILATTPLFWWMHRWYPALSSGIALLVWAIYLYFDDRQRPRCRWHCWAMLLAGALVTHFYLVILITAFLVAALAQRYIDNRLNMTVDTVFLSAIVALLSGLMYLLGYFTVPSKWAQTGGYGWYSANLLGFLDQNEASWLIPDLPSKSSQHEPTSLGTGSLVLLILLVIARLRRRQKFELESVVRKHIPLAVVLSLLALLAVTNTITLGSWTIQLPLPHRLQHGLSIFRASARFIWPSLILAVVGIAVLVTRTFKRTSLALALAFAIQLVDYSHEMFAVSQRPNGYDINIVFEKEFWARIPDEYTSVSSHPAASLSEGWAECAFAAVQTGRAAQCGYFARVQGLDQVNRLQSDALFAGNLDPHTVYWVSIGWLQTNKSALIKTYDVERASVQVVSVGAVAANSAVLIFPNCDASSECSFLGDRRTTLGVFLRSL